MVNHHNLILIVFKSGSIAYKVITDLGYFIYKLRIIETCLLRFLKVIFDLKLSIATTDISTKVIIFFLDLYGKVHTYYNIYKDIWNVIPNGYYLSVINYHYN